MHIILTVILSLAIITSTLWLTNDKNKLKDTKPGIYRWRNAIGVAIVLVGSVLMFTLIGFVLKLNNKELDDLVVLIWGVIVILPMAIWYTLGGLVRLAFEYFNDVNKIPRYVTDKETKFVLSDINGDTHSGYFEFLQVDRQLLFKLAGSDEPWRFVSGLLGDEVNTTEMAIVQLRENNGSKDDAGNTIPATL